MESRGETSELQQLVSSDIENDDSIIIIQEDGTDVKVVSPVRSNKFSSSGNTSHSSVTRSLGKEKIASTNAKVSFINERKIGREPIKSGTVRPRNIHKEPSKTDIHHHSFISQVPDVRHMERALLGLLADFHSGKLRAFGGGCTMEQMTNIREQQEKLAKLHFDLGGGGTVNDDNMETSQNTMNQLIQRLEQLSVSIEGLHSDTGSSTK